jgi:hypothetical protein
MWNPDSVKRAKQGDATFFNLGVPGQGALRPLPQFPRPPHAYCD